MSLRLVISTAVLVALMSSMSLNAQNRSEPGQGEVACAVTQPNGRDGVASGVDLAFGNQLLSVMLWPNGSVIFSPGGPGFIGRDGALGMKFGWRRVVRGRLTIEGRRLDAPAAPLRAEVNDGYGDVGFQASYVIFPTPGCWEVTGHVGPASLTFVTRVVKLGSGPTAHRDAH